MRCQAISQVHTEAWGSCGQAEKAQWVITPESQCVSQQLSSEVFSDNLETKPKNSVLERCIHKED